MKTNNLITAGVTLGMMLLASVAWANSVTLTQGAYSYNVGGEFTAVTSPDSFLGNYAPSTVLNGGFQTFCVESDVEFNPGRSYNYTLSDTDSQGRVLTLGAAYLYYEFAKGTLQGYDYTDATQRKADAGALQAALWYLQGDQTYGGYPDAVSGNSFYQLASSTLGSGHLTDPNNGTYGVDILQLWDSNANARQNQLVCVPDGGTTLGMLLLGMIGLAVVGIRNRQAALS